MERINGIIARRLLGLLQNNGQPSETMPPPLRIAVFGGPTAEGRGCARARVKIRPGSGMAQPAFCAFPHRLERLANALLLPPAVLSQLRKTLGRSHPSAAAAAAGFRVVEVVNLGEEGTDVGYATAIVRHRMYPLAEAPASSAAGYGGGPPDVVIDAYGIDNYGQQAAEVSSLYDAVHRTASASPKECAEEQRKPPVLVRLVLEEESSSSIPTIKIGDAVDDVEEGEMSLPDDRASESNLEHGVAETGGAFGMAGHVAASWLLAIHFAYVAISHCDVIADRTQHVVQKENTRQTKIVATNDATRTGVSLECDNSADPPCLFAFLAGPKGTAARPSAIAAALTPFIVQNTGWQPGADMSAGFARKTGLVGDGAGATLALLFRNVTRPVGRLDVVTLRSTAAAWRDGVAQFSLVIGSRETSFQIAADLVTEGSGGERHISYHFGMDLVAAEEVQQEGTDISLRITVSKGQRFKVLGIMLCD